jgi:hypothetical protein
MILLAVALTLGTVDLKKEKQAIAIVETADRLHPQGNDARVGKAGELGRYQIKRIVWRQWSRLPFQWAIVEAEEDYVVDHHLLWLAEHLEHVSPYTIALGYKVGLRSVWRERYGWQEMLYAQQVAAVYKELN